MAKEETGKLPEAVGKIPESGKVSVALKLPNGLQIQLCRLVPDREPVLGGGMREFMRPERHGPVVTLNGNRRKPGSDPDAYRIVFGYGITDNVDAQFFAEWLKQHADSDLVKNKLIFAYDKANDVSARASEQKTVRSGLEPILPDKDPRTPKGIKKMEKKELEDA